MASRTRSDPANENGPGARGWLEAHRSRPAHRRAQSHCTGKKWQSEMLSGSTPWRELQGCPYGKERKATCWSRQQSATGSNCITRSKVGARGMRLQARPRGNKALQTDAGVECWPSAAATSARS